MGVCWTQSSLASFPPEKMVEVPCKARVDYYLTFVVTGPPPSPTGSNLTDLHSDPLLPHRYFEMHTVGGSEQRIEELFVQVDDCTDSEHKAIYVSDTWAHSLVMELSVGWRSTS